jgi:hypothetical protein
LRRRRKPTVETYVDNTATRSSGRRHRPWQYEPHAQTTAEICVENTAKLRPQASVRPGTTAMYIQRTTSGAAGNGLYNTTKYMRGAAGISLGTTIKYLQRTTSGAAGNGLGTMIKYLRRTTSAALKNGLSTTIIPPPCSVAAFVEYLESLTAARPSVRLCVRPEFSRCVH